MIWAIIFSILSFLLHPCYRCRFISLDFELIYIVWCFDINVPIYFCSCFLSSIINSLFLSPIYLGFHLYIYFFFGPLFFSFLLMSSILLHLLFLSSIFFKFFFIWYVLWLFEVWWFELIDINIFESAIFINVWDRKSNRAWLFLSILILLNSLRNLNIRCRSLLFRIKRIIHHTYRIVYTDWVYIKHCICVILRYYLLVGIWNSTGNSLKRLLEAYEGTSWTPFNLILLLDLTILRSLLLKSWHRCLAVWGMLTHIRFAVYNTRTHPNGIISWHPFKEITNQVDTIFPSWCMWSTIWSSTLFVSPIRWFRSLWQLRSLSWFFTKRSCWFWSPLILKRFKWCFFNWFASFWTVIIYHLLKVYFFIFWHM